MRVGLIYCAVLEDEIEHFAAACPSVVATEKLAQGLHNDPPRLRVEAQRAVDALEAAHELDAIALGYGLCSRGTEGVAAKRAKLVVPRAHDCITLLLGSKERYGEYAKQFPGTYWYSGGWNRHHIPPGPERAEKLRAQYVEKYGEEDADFLMESEQHWMQTYERATFVATDVSAAPKDIDYTADCAKWLGWNFDVQRGDLGLIRALVEGPWDDDRFLVLEPGQSLRMTFDERVIEAAG